MSETAVLRVQRLRPGARLPERATPGSTGYDLQVRPRSGLSARGVQVTFGTIDSDYRGELLVTMYVLPNREPHVVRPGDRIAQLVVGSTAETVIEEAQELSGSVRGAGSPSEAGPVTPPRGAT